MEEKLKLIILLLAGLVAHISFAQREKTIS